MSLSFDEILETLSDDKMISMIDNAPILSKAEVIEQNKQLLSEEKQKLYLAFYAKAACEHVGFDGFSKENQDKFKQAIENLYNEINGECLQGDFLQRMTEATAKYIEDRHFTVGIGETTVYGGEQRPDRTVGKNFSYRTDEEKPESYELKGKAVGKTENGENFPIWEIGTMKKGNEDILVVSVYDIAHRNGDYDSWKDFIEKFDDIYVKDKEKWDSGRVILDVRGNRGGEDKPIDHIAKRLYGNMVNTYKRCEMKDTELSNHILHKHGAYRKENYEKDGLTENDLLKREHFSGKNKTLFDETSVYYPFNEDVGYKGRIDILLCSRVGSSAESAYTSFYHHPNVRYIGENTHGMQQFTQGTFRSPWGGEMRIGVTKLTYYDKKGENIEVKGHTPDVNCSGKDAFDVAMSLGVDEGRILGKHQTNEAITGKEVYADYNPKDLSDPRKAYYAKYLEPALKEIEKKNIVAERLEEVRKKMSSKSSDNNPSSDIRLVEPSIEHYEAYIEACKKMQEYIDDDKIDDSVGKEVSKGFIFAMEDFKVKNKEEFKEKIVNFYKDKREIEEPVAGQRLNRKYGPELFYFIIKGDEIIGSINARAMNMDAFDRKYGVNSCEKWDRFALEDGVKVTTSTVILNEHKGNGYAGVAKKQLFDRLKQFGINEVVGDVLASNKASNRAQEKLMERFGGFSYGYSCENPETNEVHTANRYVVSTDTSGKSKGLYENINSNICSAKLRDGPNL